MSVSVLILTLNEEINIANCIDSVSWSDDVVVLDSHSTDRTVEIAQAKGARVQQRKFDNWSSHQNWAVSNIAFKNPWVLYIDADERCTPELAEEVRRLAKPEATQSAFRIRRKDILMGVWLQHAQLYPTWLVRLFRPERIRYERLVNPIAIVDGDTGEALHHIIHYPFSHGVSHWVDRHNRYSDMEAQEWINSRAFNRFQFDELAAFDPNLRRKALKELFYRLPARPLLKFAYYYFIRRGFLDGKAGFTYSVLQAIYEYFIQLKVLEVNGKSSGVPF